VRADQELEERRRRVAGEWTGLKAAVRAETGLRLQAFAWPLLIAGFVVGLDAARRLRGRAGASAERQP
jgi:hypothetical protein